MIVPVVVSHTFSINVQGTCRLIHDCYHWLSEWQVSLTCA